MVNLMRNYVYIALLLAALISCVSAESWTGLVITNTSSWQISRQSNNMTIDITGYVDGSISPVQHRGRMLSPYAHYSKDVSANGADIKERTAAYQGMYASEDMLKMRSRTSSAGYELDKPSGSPIWTVKFYADWPVIINSSRSIDYIGRNINDKEFIGNGEDNVDSAFLYNMRLTKEQKFNLSSQNFNATIRATDDQILSAMVDEDKEIDYGLNVHSTGIADLEFTQSGSQYVVGSRDYEILSANQERYVGDYKIIRNIRMRSNHTSKSLEDDNWLPCCFKGWVDMQLPDKIGHSAESIFDCTCFDPIRIIT
jgi:hypothetical protein